MDSQSRNNGIALQTSLNVSIRKLAEGLGLGEPSTWRKRTSSDVDVSG